MALFDNPSNESGLFNFGIDEEAKGYLLDTARWTKFLAIVGFVCIGILILAGAFMSSILGSFSRQIGSSATIPGGIMVVVYIVIGVLYFFPTYYLFKFSTQVKPALLTANQSGFNHALSNLRNAFRFIGILTLIILCFYALAFIIAGMGMAML